MAVARLQLVLFLTEVRFTIASLGVSKAFDRVRAFPVAAARAWNCLPPQTRAASSLMAFRRAAKAHYGRTLSDASMLYFADVFYIFFYIGRLSWPNG